MEQQYLVTQEQLEQIEHYRRMFALISDQIKDLCDSEKEDIVYGFELGKIHSHLRECFIGMMTLEDDIIRQSLNDNVTLK